MKIVLHAFGDKLQGVMEVPEETGTKFKLAMTQPIQKLNIDNEEIDLMKNPIMTICTFQWTGKTYSQKDHEYDGARVYQLVEITKK